MTGTFFSVTQPFHSIFFLEEEFNVTGIFVGLIVPINLATDCIFKKRENNFVMCCQTLGQISLIFGFYNP